MYAPYIKTTFYTFFCIIGGWDGDQSYRHCWYYNLTSRKWTKKADILESRCTHAMVCINGHVYIIGGLCTDNSTSNSVEQYSIQDDSWNTTKQGIPSLCYVETAVVGPVIYVMGDGVGHGKLHQYNVNDHHWFIGAEVPFNESQSMMTHGEYIYSFDMETCYCYSIGNDTWTSIRYSKLGDVLSAPVLWNGDVVCVSSQWDHTRSWDTLGENDKPKVAKSVINTFDFVAKRWRELFTVQEYQPSGHQGAALPMFSVDFSAW